MVTKEKDIEELRIPIQGMYANMDSELIHYDAINYTVAWLLHKNINRIFIYGMVVNARYLYDCLSNKNEVDVFMLHGEGDDDINLPSKYKTAQLSDIKIDTDTIVIGSIKYADIIETILRNDSRMCKASIINMLDI